MAVTAPNVREPQQARSAETSRRLVDAAKSLLEEQSFDETGVAEIALRAGVTTGAFYARFRDKDALLQVLEKQLHAAMKELADRQTMPEQWTGRAIERVLREHHENLVRAYREHRGVARALLLRSNNDPALKRRFDQLNGRNLPLVAKAIAKHGKVSHPSAQNALKFALLAVRCVCREVILFNQTWPGEKALSDAALVEELTRMVMGYLGLKPALRT